MSNSASKQTITTIENTILKMGTKTVLRRLQAAIQAEAQNYEGDNKKRFLEKENALIDTLDIELEKLINTRIELESK